MGFIAGLGICWCCKNVFAFDPERVPCIKVDPETSLPPVFRWKAERSLELHNPAPEALARSDPQPTCPECAKSVNAIYRQIPGFNGPFMSEEDTIAQLATSGEE